MTEPIDRVAPVGDDRRRAARRRSDRNPAAEDFDSARGAASLPAVTGPAVTGEASPPPRPPREPAETAFVAQVMGQGGQKRGLRGGQPVLQQARSAYLEAEWSGPHDRRPPSGAVTRTKV